MEIVPGVEVPALAQSRAPRGLLYLSHVAIQLCPIVLTSMSAVPPTTTLVRPGAPTTSEWSCQMLMPLTVALGHGREGIAADVWPPQACAHVRCRRWCWRTARPQQAPGGSRRRALTAMSHRSGGRPVPGPQRRLRRLNWQARPLRMRPLGWMPHPSRQRLSGRHSCVAAATCGAVLRGFVVRAQPLS